jgi:transcriptional regulator with XRE-family HTH domain
MSASEKGKGAEQLHRGRPMRSPKTPLGRFIRQRQSELGISHRQLAQRLGIPDSRLSNIANGTVQMTHPIALSTWCQALELESDRMTRRTFLKLIGTAGVTFAVATRGPAAPVQLKYQGLLLDSAESLALELQDALYRGQARHVLEVAHHWYHRLISADLPEKDPAIAALQIRFGLLLGEAQEAVYPWYQRPQIAIRTYDDVEQRILLGFPLNTFPRDYARLYTLRAPLNRELKQYEQSCVQDEEGLGYAQAAGDAFLYSTLLRMRAHVMATQGDAQRWERELHRARRYVEQAGHHHVEELVSLIQYNEGEGAKRLAYNPRQLLSESQRSAYASRGLAAFKASRRILDRQWPHLVHLAGVHGSPLMTSVSEAQCFVWIAPHEALRLLEPLRAEAERLLPCLLPKIEHTAYCAKRRLNWRQGEPLPVFDLDAKYRLRPSSQQ